MPDLYSASGSKIYIGGVLATKNANFVVGDYAGQTWVEIDGWETMGDIGDNAEAITTQLINQGRDLKQKGTRNAGTMENVFAVIPSDAGQIALRAAALTSSNYAFRVILSSGQTLYYIALVMTAQQAGGGANDVLKLNATLEVNSNVVVV